MNQLMPAALVAKIAEDEFAIEVDSLLDECRPCREFILGSQHAWIVAAEWLEERAGVMSPHFLVFVDDRPTGQTVPNESIRALRAAARELRRAAREDVEP